MITSNSRYINSTIVTETKADGTSVMMITPSRAQTFTFTYSFYVVTGSDRIDNIANAFYGDASKWWTIADANPEIMKWDSLEPGTVLRVPNA